VLGIEIAPEEVEYIFKKIGCSVAPTKKKRCWLVSVPSYRRDLEGEIDLIEEAVRFYGYEKVPATLPAIQLVGFQRETFADPIEKIRDFLKNAGFDEVITLSLVPEGKTEKGVKIVNPLTQEQSALRQDIISNLVKTAVANLNQGNHRLRLFEIGNIYYSTLEGFKEEKRLGMIMTEEKEGVLFLKSLVKELAKLFGLRDLKIGLGKLAGFDFLESSFLIMFGGKNFAVLGEVVVNKSTLSVSEVFIQNLQAEKLSTIRFRPWIKFPPVTRDFSFLVPETITWSEIEEKVYHFSDLIRKIKFFDLYCSSEMPQGYKSIAFSVSFQSPEKTLSHSEVDVIQKGLVSELEKMGLKLRQ